MAVHLPWEVKEHLCVRELGCRAQVGVRPWSHAAKQACEKMKPWEQLSAVTTSCLGWGRCAHTVSCLAGPLQGEAGRISVAVLRTLNRSQTADRWCLEVFDLDCRAERPFRFWKWNSWRTVLLNCGSPSRLYCSGQGTLHRRLLETTVTLMAQLLRYQCEALNSELSVNEGS